MSNRLQIIDADLRDVRRALERQLARVRAGLPPDLEVVAAVLALVDHAETELAELGRAGPPRWEPSEGSLEDVRR